MDTDDTPPQRGAAPKADDGGSGAGPDATDAPADRVDTGVADGLDPGRDDASHASDLPDRLSRGLEPVGLLDWAMVVLAVLHILVLSGSAYLAFLPAFVAPYLVYADLGITLVYIVEYLGRLSVARRKVQYVRTHWYDLVGLLPLANVTFRAFRLVRLLRMWVVWRLDWEHEPTWSTAFVRHVLLRYLDVILQVITKPLMLAMIKLVEAPLRRARFAAMAGTVLDKQRRGIENVTLMTMKVNKTAKGIAELGITQKAVHVVTDAVIDQVVRVLRSEELNDLMADAVRDVLRAAADGISDSARAAQDVIPSSPSPTGA